MNHQPVIRKGKTSAGHKKLTNLKNSYSNLLGWETIDSQDFTGTFPADDAETGVKF
jgi:hypothetical protein